MVPSFDGGDDFVGVLGPGKGLWICIGVVEEAVDGIFEFLEGAKHAALEALFSAKKLLTALSEVEYESLGMLLSGIMRPNLPAAATGWIPFIEP